MDKLAKNARTIVAFLVVICCFAFLYLLLFKIIPRQTKSRNNQRRYKMKYFLIILIPIFILSCAGAKKTITTHNEVRDSTHVIKSNAGTHNESDSVKKETSLTNSETGVTVNFTNDTTSHSTAKDYEPITTIETTKDIHGGIKTTIKTNRPIKNINYKDKGSIFTTDSSSLKKSDSTFINKSDSATKKITVSDKTVIKKSPGFLTLLLKLWWLWLILIVAGYLVWKNKGRLFGI